MNDLRTLAATASASYRRPAEPDRIRDETDSEYTRRIWRNRAAGNLALYGRNDPEADAKLRFFIGLRADEPLESWVESDLATIAS